MKLKAMSSSSMNNAGNPDSPETPTPNNRLRPLLTLGALGLAIAAAFVIGVQFISILYAILFPPLPPLIEGATLVSSTQHDYGVDDWVYTVDQEACSVAEYYIEQGGSCDITPMLCGEISIDIPRINQHIARCIGDVRFSIFAMRWRTLISTGDLGEPQTIFRLSREVFWTGEIPPATADNFFNQ